MIRDCRSLTRYLAGFPVYPRASQHCVLIRDCRSLTRYLAGFPVYPRASQHCVFTILKQHGRAAVVLPDNVDSFVPAQSGFAQRFALSMSHRFPRAPF